MAIEWILPLAGFAWVTCITPGPNNILLTASGARFGFRRTVPHVLGISAGMGLMLMLVGNIVSDICVALVDPRVRFGE